MTEAMAHADEEWKAAWQPVIDKIGQDLGDGQIHYGADRVEAGAIRRYLEPLEFDCALHSDREIARVYGFSDVTVPYTGMSSFALPAVWSPGERVFASADRNAQPARGSVRPRVPEGGPPVTGYFATDTEMEFFRAVVAGERLGRRGQKLVACTPKETKVGRGAFVTFENEIVDEMGMPVARIRVSLFLYAPRQE
jgi:hypothetical protein